MGAREVINTHEPDRELAIAILLEGAKHDASQTQPWSRDHRKVVSDGELGAGRAVHHHTKASIHRDHEITHAVTVEIAKSIRAIDERLREHAIRRLVREGAAVEPRKQQGNR